jgi:sugar phosphate isomerase/epimerase
MYTRRDFGRFALAAIQYAGLQRSLAMFGAETKADGTINGVRIGLESYSLSTLPHDTIVDTMIRVMVEMGLREGSLTDATLQPSDLAEKLRVARGNGGQGRTLSAEQQAAMTEANNALKQWKASVSLDYFKDVRKKFNAAGLNINAFFPNGIAANSTDVELERNCDIAKALGAKVIISMMPKSAAKRFAPLAEKNDLRVALTGRPSGSSTDPDLIMVPADYMEAVGYSKNYGIDLDTGDATAGGFDVMPFLREHHDKFISLHLKDRKKDKTSVPWGEGDSPVREALLLIQEKKYPILGYIDCDYPTAPGGDRVADVKKCLAYAKSVLKG